MSKMTVPDLESNLYQELNYQLEYFGLLREISQRQRSLLEIGDLDTLLSTRSEKDKIVHSIKSHGSRLELLREEWHKSKEQICRESQEKICTLLRKLSQIIADLLNLEKENYHLLEESRENVRQELSDLFAHSNAARGYLRNLNDSTRFFDQIG